MHILERLLVRLKVKLKTGILAFQDSVQGKRLHGSVFKYFTLQYKCGNSVIFNANYVFLSREMYIILSY